VIIKPQSLEVHLVLTRDASVQTDEPLIDEPGRPAMHSPNYHHLEMAESLGNPYGPNGRAALALMKLAPA
jgi:hypothetical protein